MADFTLRVEYRLSNQLYALYMGKNATGAFSLALLIYALFTLFVFVGFESWMLFLIFGSDALAFVR